MANTKQLPADVLENIAQQVSARLGSFPNDEIFFSLDESVAAPLVDLGETFEVWSLPQDALDEMSEGVDLSEISRQTGIWHHQIRSNNQARSFARSKPLGATADSWSLRELFVSSLAEDMHTAIDWVEANVPASLDVRYLSVPMYQVDAFWLVAEPNSPDYVDWNDQLVIIRAGASSSLTPLDVVDAQQFFAVLRAEDRGAGLR